MKHFSIIRLGVTLVAATGVLASSLVALSTAESEALTKTVIDTRAAELPAKATKLVGKASKEERDAVAAAVVSAAGLAHPAALVNTVSAVVKKYPETAVAVVKAAIEAAPEQATAAVAAVAKAAPSQAEKAVAAASKQAPERAAAFERQVAYSSAPATGAQRSRTVVSAGSTVNPSGPITQEPTPIGKVPTNLYAQPGSDPLRP